MTTETKEAPEQKWPPEQIWLPTGVVMLAAVSPELENVEGAYWVRKDVADAAVEQARREVWEKAIAAIPAVGVTFPNGYEEWVDAPSYRESVVAALAAAAKEK